jgi:hypothetical protein
MTTSTISLVLRVLSEPASHGRLVGHAEIVDTGEIVVLSEPGELVDLVRRLAAPEGLERQR